MPHCMINYVYHVMKLVVAAKVQQGLLIMVYSWKMGQYISIMQARLMVLIFPFIFHWVHHFFSQLFFCLLVYIKYDCLAGVYIHSSYFAFEYIQYGYFIYSMAILQVFIYNNAILLVYVIQYG